MSSKLHQFLMSGYARMLQENPRSGVIQQLLRKTFGVQGRIHSYDQAVRDLFRLPTRNSLACFLRLLKACHSVKRRHRAHLRGYPCQFEAGDVATVYLYAPAAGKELFHRAEAGHTDAIQRLRDYLADYIPEHAPSFDAKERVSIESLCHYLRSCYRYLPEAARQRAEQRGAEQLRRMQRNLASRKAKDAATAAPGASTGSNTSAEPAVAPGD